MSAFTVEVVPGENGNSHSVELVSFKPNGNGKVLNGHSNDAYSNDTDSTNLNKDRQSYDNVVSVIGNGFYGLAITRRLRDSGVNVIVGSRRSEIDEKYGNTTDYLDASNRGDIIILAIPRYAYDTVVPNLEDSLRGKIVIDISNKDRTSDSCNAVYLQRLLPDSHVVKGLNTLSAWSLEYDLFGSSKDTYICADSQKRKRIVMDLMRDMGLNPIDRGRLNAANHVENLPLRIFPQWRFSSILTIVVLIIISTYHFIRSYGAEKHSVEHLALHEANYILCWEAITLFSLVYLPGNIASVIQIYKGTKYSKFPMWLDLWMKSRKQLGLTALLFAAMHACASLLLIGGGYVFRMMRMIPIQGTTGLMMYREFTWKAEISLLMAILSFSIFTILGITSLPSVNARMSWREWDFVQSFMGYLGLCFAVAHVYVYSHEVYKKERYQFYKWDMPPSVYFMPLLPSIVLLFKFILMLPCIRYRLIRIRTGRYNKPSVAGSWCC